MTGDITGIDHVLINANDLEGDRDTYIRLGFHPTPRGRHPQWGTGNYCFMLERGYLELIGVVDPDEFAANASRRGNRDREPGLSALALATDDGAAAAANLNAAGIAADGPKDLSRLIEEAGETSEPRFQIVHLPDAATPGLPMFLCHHQTPELVRRDGWTHHPNGARRIKSVAVPCENTEPLIKAYSRLLGENAVTATDAIVTLWLGEESILFASHDDLDELYPDLLPESGDVPCPAVITLEVADLEATTRVMASASIPLLREQRSVMVAPDDACGVALVFTA